MGGLSVLWSRNTGPQEELEGCLWEREFWALTFLTVFIMACCCRFNIILGCSEFIFKFLFSLADAVKTFCLIFRKHDKSQVEEFKYLGVLFTSDGGVE